MEHISTDSVGWHDNSKPVSVSGSQNGVGTSSVYNSAVFIDADGETSVAPITKRSSPKGRIRRGTSIASVKRSVRLIRLLDVLVS